MKTIIGIECHVQLNTKTKLFSRTPVESGEPNEFANGYDLGLPGYLPRINRSAIEKAIKIGLALNATINTISYFDRKHYFYPDLPLGFQCTQFFKPICHGGYVDISTSEGIKRVLINKMHLESDSGKIVNLNNKVFVDYNRCGVPLMEIVTEPCLTSSEEAKLYVFEIYRILRSIKVSDCNLESGNLRADINVSINIAGKHYDRVELKNINSFNFIRKALDFEINRQVDCASRGDYWTQHTRGYDSNKNITYFMREKEKAFDYRYFRDFNILPVVLSKEQLEFAKISMEELPSNKQLRLKKIINNNEIIDALINGNELLEYYDTCCRITQNYEMLANIICVDLVGYCNKHNQDISNIDHKYVCYIVDLLYKGEVNTKVAKDLLEQCVLGFDPSKLVIEKKLLKIKDRDEIKAIVNSVFLSYPNEREAYKSNPNLINFFIGKIMKVSPSLDLSIATNILEELLK